MARSHLSKHQSGLKRLLTVGAVALVVSTMGTLWAHPAAADPVFDLTVSPTTVPAGETFTVSLSGASDRNYAEAYIGIHGRLDDGTPLSELTSLVGCTGNAGPCLDDPGNAGYDIPLGSLTSGQAIAVTITLRVDPDAAPADFVLRYQFVGGSAGGTIVEGPTVTITEPTPAAADLGVSLTAGPVGLLTSRVQYTVRVANSGPDAVSSATVETSFTGPVSSVSSADGCVLSGGKVTCPVGSIPPGGSAARRFDAHLGLLTVGPFNATATRTASDLPDPDPSNDSSTESCTAVTSLLVLC